VEENGGKVKWQLTQGGKEEGDEGREDDLDARAQLHAQQRGILGRPEHVPAHHLPAAFLHVILGACSGQSRCCIRQNWNKTTADDASAFDCPVIPAEKGFRRSNLAAYIGLQEHLPLHLFKQIVRVWVPDCRLLPDSLSMPCSHGAQCRPVRPITLIQTS